MSARTIVKIIFLIIATILAIVAIIIGKIIVNGKAGKDRSQEFNLRRIMRIRMLCFLVMMILLFICFVI